MNKTLFLVISLLGTTVLASGGGGDHGGIPAATIVSQIANIGILVAIIYFWQGKAIAESFKAKRANFLESVNLASKAKSDAEAKKNEVEARVQELKTGYQASLSEASKNAEESYRTQIADAKNSALRMKDTATGSLENEIQKQIELLRVEAFEKSAEMAEKKLETSLTDEQRKSWTDNFTRKGVH